MVPPVARQQSLSGVYFRTPEEEGFDHNTSLFKAAKAILDGKNEAPLSPIDKDEFDAAYNAAYLRSDSEHVDARDLGGAAALHIYRKFVAAVDEAHGRGPRSAQIPRAIAEGGRLFDTLGAPGGGGTKQDVVNSAAVTVARLLAQEPLAEKEFEESRRKAYEEKNGATLDARDIGTAAALKVFNEYTAPGADTTALGGEEAQIKRATDEAKRLFAELGAGGGGTVEDSVNSAAVTVAKLLAELE